MTFEEELSELIEKHIGRDGYDPIVSALEWHLALARGTTRNIPATAVEPRRTASKTSTMRDRCQEFLGKLALDPALRHRSADALAEFVMIERGRAADTSLKGTLPVVLYFADDAGRDEFMAVVHEAIPGMTARKWP